MSLSGSMTTSGVVPKMEIVEDLVLWLREVATSDRKADGVYYTSTLAQQHPASKDNVNIAAGLLAILPTEQDYVVLFRPEVAEMVTWAGNPKKPLRTEGSKVMLSPRNSFDAWKEQVRNVSRPWTEIEIREAEFLSRTLQQLLKRKLANQDGEAAKALVSHENSPMRLI
eukprot:Colp12_sorted_trinity150504_noHs@26156